MDALIKRLDKLERLIESQSIYHKEILTFREGCRYCNFKASHMYKLTSQNKIPFYKPNGKLIFFRRSELDAWLLHKRMTPQLELGFYLTKKRRTDHA